MRRQVLALLGVVVAAAALAGCAPASRDASGAGVASSITPPLRIRTVAFDSTPFEPPNAYPYSEAVLRSVRAGVPFARWSEARDDFVIVVRADAHCAATPTAVDLTAGVRTVAVEVGPAAPEPHGLSCRPGRVLTTRFPGSRLLDRTHVLDLHLGGTIVRLPPALPLTVQKAASEPSHARRIGIARALRQVTGTLPGYSEPDYPWEIDRAEPASKDVAISWTGGTGTGACDRNASLVYVQEAATTVTVDIATAPPPVSPAPVTPAVGSTAVVTSCAGVGVTLTAVVHLAHPLGSRTLLQHVHGPRPAGEDAY